MKFKQLIILPLAMITLAGCDGDSADDGTDEIFEAFVSSVEFNDTNLENCVNAAIADEGINQSKDLVSLSCDQPIADITGLEAYLKLTTLDLSTNTAMSCADIDLIQKQLIKSSVVNGRNSVVDVVQSESCFYNELEFADSNLRDCVLASYNNDVSWISVDDLSALSCASADIKSLTGIEQFPLLSSLDISETSVDCQQVGDFVEANPAIAVDAPFVCKVSNVEFADPEIASCVDMNAPSSDAVIDLKELTCINPVGSDVEDLGGLGPLDGLELLTSLETLNLESTAANCQAYAFLALELPNTEITAPLNCTPSETMLLSDVPRLYPVYEGDTIASYRIFEDNQIQACYDGLLKEDMLVVGDITSIWCNDQSVATYSIRGVESFLSLETFGLRKTEVTDYSPMFDLPLLTRLHFRNSPDFNDDLLRTVSDGMGDRVTYMNFGGTKVLNWTYINEFTVLEELNLTQTNLRFDPAEPDWGTLDQVTSLTTLTFNKTPILSVDPLLGLTNLIKLTLKATTYPGKSEVFLPCSEITELLSVNPVLKTSFDDPLNTDLTLDNKSCYGEF